MKKKRKNYLSGGLRNTRFLRLLHARSAAGAASSRYNCCCCCCCKPSDTRVPQVGCTTAFRLARPTTDVCTRSTTVFRGAFVRTILGNRYRTATGPYRRPPRVPPARFATRLFVLRRGNVTLCDTTTFFIVRQNKTRTRASVSLVFPTRQAALL